MKKKTGILIAGGVFYGVMLFLAVFARRFYETTLPKVRIGYLEQRSFLVEGEQRYLVAMPEELLGKKLFCLMAEEINGEVRYVAYERNEVVYGEEKDGYYPVLDGINGYTMIVTEGMEALEEGKEVLVLNEEEIKSW